ncbi:hypothetical protein EZV62_027676 [Acer yangbiense]|uniref:Retrovirus-related Pol polyprotein from transposon TNT 1-94-like beta-barrel domain-containing protein n=1 Tax=Acer yangbiense TaxID=1000413 RepID=A0A5C7GVK1_9ROSI|nr:hypothetical protein EZV62_027676 [Acer yangbiense]
MSRPHVVTDGVSALDEGAEVILGKLVAASASRHVDPEFASGHRIMFSVEYPFMLLSLADSILVEGCDPYSEDLWTEIPTIDQDTGIAGSEPTETLIKVRSDKVLLLKRKHKGKLQIQAENCPAITFSKTQLGIRACAMAGAGDKDLETATSPESVVRKETSSSEKKVGNPLGSYCSVKLNHENYLLWKNLVLPVIRGNRMEGYITGAKKCPPEFIITDLEQEADETLEENPEYEDWIVHDQILLGWLYNSMEPDVASEVIGSETSKDLWESINTLFGLKTKSNIAYYKREFQKLQKGGMKMSDYLKAAKKLADNLALAGRPVPLEDLVSQVLDGLDSVEYNPLVCQINEREDISWIDLQAKLLSYEKRLEKINAGFSSINLGQVSANYVGTKNTGGQTGQNRSQGFLQGNQNKGSSPFSRDSVMHTHNNRTLLLKDILHVPDIKKNLLSISQLTACNNIIVEFDSCGCVVKDKATGVALLQGKLKEGLYQLDFPTNKHVSSAPNSPAYKSSYQSYNKSSYRSHFPNQSSNCNSAQLVESASSQSLNSLREIWHRRLGHPSNRVLDQIL